MKKKLAALSFVLLVVAALALPALAHATTITTGYTYTVTYPRTTVSSQMVVPNGYSFKASCTSLLGSPVTYALTEPYTAQSFGLPRQITPSSGIVTLWTNKTGKSVTVVVNMSNTTGSSRVSGNWIISN